MNQMINIKICRFMEFKFDKKLLKNITKYILNYFNNYITTKKFLRKFIMKKKESFMLSIIFNSIKFLKLRKLSKIINKKF